MKMKEVVDLCQSDIRFRALKTAGERKQAFAEFQVICYFIHCYVNSIVIKSQIILYLFHFEHIKSIIGSLCVVCCVLCVVCCVVLCCVVLCCVVLCSVSFFFIDTILNYSLTHHLFLTFFAIFPYNFFSLL